MADDVLDQILNERFSTPESTAETVTTETKPEETTATAAVESAEVVNEELENGATLTEVTEPVTTDPTTTVVEVAKPEIAVETATPSPLQTLFQKLGVTSEDEISERLIELQTIKGTQTLGKLIDTLQSKGIDPAVAVAFHKLDLDKLSSKEKIAWNTKMQHPALSDEQIEALVEEEYGDDTNLAQQAKLAIAGEAAGKLLAEQKVKILDPTVTKEVDAKQKETQEAELARVEGWKTTPKVKEILSTLGKIEQKVIFSTFGEDKPVNKSFNFSYQIPKEGLADVEAALRNIGIAQGLDSNNPESAVTLKAMAENIYKIQNFDKILASLSNTVASQMHKEAALKFHNANPNRGGATIDAGKKSLADQRLEATLKAL